MEIIIPLVTTIAAAWYVIRHLKKLTGSKGCGCGSAEPTNTIQSKTVQSKKNHQTQDRKIP